MKITRIRVYQVDLPLHEGNYKWSGGKSVDVFDSTVVQVETEDGRTGHGEVCPLGPAYLPAYARGVRCGLEELAPTVLGMDPREHDRLNEHMDQVLKGHPYVKSGIDIACWDLAAQSANAPLVTMLGGRCGDDYVLYRAISQLPPEEMAENVRQYHEQGYRRFQLKVGGNANDDIARIHAARAVLNPDDVLIADANTGWRMHDAMRVAAAVRDLDVYIEQPCEEYQQCLSIRRHTDRPFILDENIDSIHALTRAITDRACDGVNLKISKLGGITRARQARDLCRASGLVMTIEDTWGGDITTAAISHLAHSTAPEYLLTSTDFNSYVTQSIADGAPQRQNGRMSAPSTPGLGITPRFDVLGDPVAEWTA